MARKKTTKAEVKSVRLNPETSNHDRAVLEIVNRLETEGFTFKQIVVDAILMADGRKPEMFTSNAPGDILASMQWMLEKFADEIKQGMKGRGYQDVDDDGQQDSPFSKTFARSFLERQQRGLGDE